MLGDASPLSCSEPCQGSAYLDSLVSFHDQPLVCLRPGARTASLRIPLIPLASATFGSTFTSRT